MSTFILFFVDFYPQILLESQTAIVNRTKMELIFYNILSVIVILSVYIIMSTLLSIFKISKALDNTHTDLNILSCNIKFFLFASLSFYGFCIQNSLSDSLFFFSLGIIYLFMEYLFSKVACFVINLSIWQKVKIYFDYLNDRQ